MKVRILADENVNYKIIEHLIDKNLDVTLLIDLERGISDYEVINLAKKIIRTL